MFITIDSGQISELYCCPVGAVYNDLGIQCSYSVIYTVFREDTVKHEILTFGILDVYYY